MSLSLSIHSTDLEALEADVLVLGVLKGSEGPYLAPNSLSEDSVEGINELLEALGASGDPDQLLRLPGLEDSGAGVVALAGFGSDQASGRSVWMLCATPRVRQAVSWLVLPKRLPSISACPLRMRLRPLRTVPCWVISSRRVCVVRPRI